MMRIFVTFALLLAGPVMAQPVTPKPVEEFPAVTTGCRGFAFQVVDIARINAGFAKPDLELYQDPSNPGRYLLQFGTRKFFDVQGHLTHTEPIEAEISPGDYIREIPDPVNGASSFRVVKKADFESRCQVSP